jgi:hypothetical protein
VAQVVEHQTLTVNVVSSTPCCATFCKGRIVLIFFNSFLFKLCLLLTFLSSLKEFPFPVSSFFNLNSVNVEHNLKTPHHIEVHIHSRFEFHMVMVSHKEMGETKRQLAVSTTNKNLASASRL